ncbi:hypothetical protein H7X69_00650 [Candidatus Saccharibacteria bacterium]|nr:hypothetical protein [Candidatus Saccharibacteria bacterium]
MLTLEEERERAVKISQLYIHTPKESGIARDETLDLFKWSKIIKATVLLSLSGIAVNALITVFANVVYESRQDVAAASMLFFGAFLAGCYLLYKASRHFFDKLYDVTKNYSLMFWSSLFFLVPMFFLLKNLTISALNHDLLSILLYLGLHGALFIAVSVAFVLLLAYIVRKSQKN